MDQSDGLSTHRQVRERARFFLRGRRVSEVCPCAAAIVGPGYAPLKGGVLNREGIDSERSGVA